MSWAGPAPVPLRLWHSLPASPGIPCSSQPSQSWGAAGPHGAMAPSTLSLTGKLLSARVVCTHISQQSAFSAGFIWVIAGEQLALIKWNTEYLVNDLSPFFFFALWVRGKQTASRVCAEGPSSLSQHPDAEMTVINHSAQNRNCTERTCTAGARGGLLSERCDISGREWHSGRKVCQQMSLLPVIYPANPARSKPWLCSPQNASGSTLAQRAPCTAVAARLGLMLALGVNASKCPCSKQPQKWGSSEATGFFIQASDQLICY